MHLTLLHASLLGFALWTMGLLVFTIGVHRWSRILTGRSAINAFPADAPTGPDWYRRATRAHVNCIENLPVFTAIVVTATSVGASGALLDILGITVLCARVVQSLVHVSFMQTSRVVSVRFSFFSIQVGVVECRSTR